MTRIIPLSELSDSSELQAFVAGGVVSIGNFDGVHRGHATLLNRNRKLADKLNGPAIVVILDPHPAAILRPERTPPKLTWAERRAELMTPLGIDALVVCETTREFLQLTAVEFFEVLIVGQLDAEAMVEGPNFFFGRDRGGNVDVLRQLCDKHGIELQIVDPTSDGDEMISSTRIRALIQNGDVAAAAGLLGTDYRIRGVVHQGVGRGRKIGFPTANLTDVDVIIPGVGVYAGLASVNNRTIPAAIHIGPNPTFDSDQTVKVEVHLIDYDGDLYDRPMMVDFVDRVRDVARFDSPDELVDQLYRDIQNVRTLLPQRGS